jgi:hypothetical protein
MAHPGGIVFVYNIQFFPKAQTLVGKHLHKAVETPIIVHHAVTYLPLAPFFGSLVLLFFDDHLPLGKIANDHSPFSQCASDEVRSFVQTVSLFATFLLGNPLVDTRKMNIPAEFLLAFVALGTNLVELLVVPAVAFEAADVVEVALIVVARFVSALMPRSKATTPSSRKGRCLRFFRSLGALCFSIFCCSASSYTNEQ